MERQAFIDFCKESYSHTAELHSAFSFDIKPTLPSYKFYTFEAYAVIIYEAMVTEGLCIEELVKRNQQGLLMQKRTLQGKAGQPPKFIRLHMVDQGENKLALISTSMIAFVATDKHTIVVVAAASKTEAFEVAESVEEIATLLGME